MKQLERIHTRIAPLKQILLEHGVYSRIDSLPALHVFMQHHVFAVWDFMSLLKCLQQELCQPQIPWLPPINRLGCRLVNEIVLAEESDDDGQEGFASHFDLYVQAMQNCGADTIVVHRFLDELRSGSNLPEALATAETPLGVRDFVQQTFASIDGGDICAIASAFTFGREDLLPDLFREIVESLDTQVSGDLSAFKYYLERHIDLDEDQHGPMAERLIAMLCGEDEAKWQIAEDSAYRALESRLRLWDCIEKSLGKVVQN